MQEYAIRRLLLIIPTMVLVSVMVFLGVRLIPGDIITTMLIGRSGSQEAMGAESETGRGFEEITFDEDALRKELGLDTPFHTQYIEWISGIFLRGDFGKSLWNKQDVLNEVRKRIFTTFELGLLAFLMTQIIALPVGIYSGVRQDSWVDQVGRTFAVINLATPNFWLATMVIVWGAFWFNWTPPIPYVHFHEDPLRNLQILAIPALLSGWSMSAGTVRLLRTIMLDVLRQDYVRTAWAKGLKERVIVLRHALRNTLIVSVGAIMGPIGVMVGGMVLMEQIFAIPGMGRLLLDTLNARDYPYVSTLNLLYGSWGMFMILVHDLSYAWFDPRIRYR